MRRFFAISGLCLLTAGCSRQEGKALLDFIQSLLLQDTWFRWIACLLLVYVVLQALRIIQLAFRFTLQFIKKSYRFLFVWGKRNLILIAILGTLLWAFSNPLIDLLQNLEQHFFNPVYLDEFGHYSEEHLTAIYEAELSKKTDPYEKAVIQRRTRETAEKIQSTPLAIYEAAYLECGLKPFEVRSDGVAAGWIQFTRAGLGNLRHEGKPVAFDQVLEACRKRDVVFMMDLTEQYLLRKYEQSGRKPLHNTIDLYLAIFAPALIGAPSERVVYQGFDNPSYYKNDGLDGWYVATNSAGRRQIFRKRSERDGKITIWEIYLALESKKGKLLTGYIPPAF